uniref:Uncharacterized protein n=1 Tax=Oryza punctata TaxID=4537 RepID=A0A0E0LRS7_ORYPU
MAPVLARLDVSTVAAGKQQLVHARRRPRAHAHLPVPGTGSAIRLPFSSQFLGGNGSRRLTHNAAAGEKSAADHAAGALEDELRKEHSGDAAAATSPASSRDNHSAPQQTEVTADTNDSDKEKTNDPARDVCIKAGLLGYNHGGGGPLEPGAGPHYNH